MDGTEVSKHRTRESCWIVIDHTIYDITGFLNSHPGGPGTLLKYAGGDASTAFHQVHTIQTLLDHLPKGFRYFPDKCLGPLQGDLSTLARTESHDGSSEPETAVDKAASSQSRTIPDLTTCVTLSDFHDVARPLLSERAYTYVSSTATESSPAQPLPSPPSPWSAISFRPRVLRNVSSISTSASMLSRDCRYPFFIPPMGLVGSVHPDGELAFARASARCGIHYCVSTATSKLHEEIMQCFISEQISVAASSNSAIPPAKLFFQLYVHSRVEVTVNLLHRIRALGYDGLFITVDTPVIGKRTADRRLAAREILEASPAGDTADSPEEVQGGRAPPGVLSETLNWDDLAWIRKEWRGKIVIKGVQSGEDARLAAQHGVDAVYLSNHGGRQLQYAPSALDTLLDIHETSPDVLRCIEVYVDGGFSTGADILKALCLGAKAVGIGRPFLYAAAAYGESGVVRAVNLLAEEIQIGMRLLGVASVAQLDPKLLRLGPTRKRHWPSYL